MIRYKRAITIIEIRELQGTPKIIKKVIGKVRKNADIYLYPSCDWCMKRIMTEGETMIIVTPTPEDDQFGFHYNYHEKCFKEASSEK